MTEKVKGLPLIKRISSILFALGGTDRFFFGMLVGFIIAVLVIYAAERNPSLYEDRVDAAQQCAAVGFGESYCLQLIIGDEIEEVADEESMLPAGTDSSRIAQHPDRLPVQSCASSSPRRRHGQDCQMVVGDRHKSPAGR